MRYIDERNGQRIGWNEHEEDTYHEGCVEDEMNYEFNEGYAQEGLENGDYACQACEEALHGIRLPTPEPTTTTEGEHFI